MPMLRDQGAVVEAAAATYGTRLGGGIFSDVFAMPDGKVLKVARSMDGTYWWLKYAHSLTLAGIKRPMVPVVYELVPVDYRGRRGYVAIMEKYECARQYVADLGLDPDNAAQWLEGWEDAHAAFAGWCRMCGIAPVPFNDMHEGNVMLDGDEWVITDPSSARGDNGMGDTTEAFLKGFYEH